MGDQTRAIIYWGSGEPKEADKETLRAASVELTSFEDFLALGRERASEPAPAGPDDTCTIMYTRSGGLAPTCCLLCAPLEGKLHVVALCADGRLTPMDVSQQPWLLPRAA